MNAVPVTILLIEDDPGHARLIEKNVRRAGVNNAIVPLSDGTSAMAHLFGRDSSGVRTVGQALLVLLDLNLPDMSGIDILHGRQGGDPALLRSGLQRLHHQAGRLRQLRHRDPSARPVPGGDAGARDRVMRPTQ